MKQVDKATIKVIGKLIDENHHGQAYGFLAHVLGLTEVAAKLKKVCEIHDIAGHLEAHLFMYRYELFQEVEAEAEANWNWNEIRVAL